ncbi:MAG: pyridinium-3,5-bisthiocarboxylic acid mononucleotide nickel chelatase [Clostridia bacterium]|nr:pyridinium-3,5-bisthiocarboxylic acid mononucleotide nickel chelatase [Clostridia bacterium]
MKIAYFDCFSGVSGDMCLGALLSNGLSKEELINHLKLLNIEGWDLIIKQVNQHSIAATDVTVKVSDHQPHRHLKDILELIDNSKIPKIVKKKSSSVFLNLARAEARVHGTTPENVHFHEVGAVDAIIDIVGTVLGLYLLKVEKIIVSPLPLGYGWVNCQHGKLPSPAPATLYLLKNCPIYGTEDRAELVTPTGAALMSTLADEFGYYPTMNLKSIGFGAGKTILDHPNLLRLAIGEITNPSLKTQDTIVVVETNIDDMNPEFYPVLQSEVMAAGAVDAYFTPIQMKKGRPGILLTCLCIENNLPQVTSAIFRNSSTLGLRFRHENRIMCKRRIIEASTPYGLVKVKLGYYKNPCSGQIFTNIAPEFESCLEIAQKTNTPIKEVYRAALTTAQTIQDNLQNNEDPSLK